MTASERPFDNWVVEQLGAFNIFTNVATIFHGDDTGSNPVGDVR